MPSTWPVSLQQLLNQDSFDLQMGDTTVRSQMDVGLDKVRSRYTDAIDVYTSTINMNMTDYQTLVDFYRTTLNNGVGTFSFNEPLTGDAATWRFANPPEIRPLGGTYFQVTMKWEKLP